MKKIIITGSNGLLGQNLLNLLLEEKETYKVIGFSRGANRSGRDDFEYHNLDITDTKKLQTNLLKIQPDVVINTAAMTNVDACETDKENCHLLNVDVVQQLTSLCSEIQTHLIHISTDFIFDGKNGPYTEEDTPSPLSYYGETKLQSEEILSKSTIDYTILRTILVYGIVAEMSRSNIVLWVKEALEKGNPITIVDDQYRMPTYVEDLALACKLCIDKKATGVFHISSNQLLSIYKIAQEIADAFDLDKKLIQPISTTTLNQLAVRPVSTGFDLTKTNRELNLYPKSFTEDLQRFKEKLTQIQI
ncbi:MAG: SDR family oxidoreductase [Polaribacter sp.]|nr:SDR family oxidoreductase [Polaribacter sp.]